MKDISVDIQDFEVGESVLEPFGTQERDMAYFIYMTSMLPCHSLSCLPAYARLSCKTQSTRPLVFEDASELSSSIPSNTVDPFP